MLEFDENIIEESKKADIYAQAERLLAMDFDTISKKDIETSMRTIANADHIVVLKDGVVAEQGSPKELSQYDSIYSHMAAQQKVSQGWKM